MFRLFACFLTVLLTPVVIQPHDVISSQVRGLILLLEQLNVKSRKRE